MNTLLPLAVWVFAMVRAVTPKLLWIDAYVVFRR
jgi:hypothetical protein